MPLYHLPHAVQLVVGVDTVTVVEMREQRLAAGLNSDYPLPAQLLRVTAQTRQAKAHRGDHPVLQHFSQFVRRPADFRTLRHVPSLSRYMSCVSVRGLHANGFIPMAWE